MTAIRTSSLSGVGNAAGGGPFTQTGSYYSAVSDILISGSLKVSGSISASAFTITTPGTPEIASSTDIILNAANAVKISSSSLKLASFTNSQTASLVAENGAMIYNSSKNKFGFYAGNEWDYFGQTFPYEGRAVITGSATINGTIKIMGEQTTTGSLIISGSKLNMTGDTQLSGSLILSGSIVSLNTIFQIVPTNSTTIIGTVPTGSIIISASVTNSPKPFIWDGWGWQPFY